MTATNWTDLRDQLGSALADSFKGLVEGAAADIQAYANAIASDLVLAASTGDERGARHLRAQLKVLAGIHRLRLAEGRDDIIWTVINTALKAVQIGLGANKGSNA